MTNAAARIGKFTEVSAHAGSAASGLDEADTGHTHEAACLNCGEALIGPCCHQCGQRGHVHRSLSAFFHDLLHGAFHFEGKIWRTLPMLAWRPGHLTREYIEGRRASYVSPIALFLFVVFVTFALFSALGGGIHVGDGIATDANTSITRARADLDGRIKALEEKRVERTAQGRDVAAIQSELATLKRDRDTLGQLKLPEGDTKVTGKGPGGVVIARGLNTVWAKAKENPSLLIYKVQSSAYKYSWLLIPISVPFMWLMFPFSRRYHLYDHTVFVTYSISFVLILIALVSLGGYLGLSWLVALPLLYMPWHIYRQLKVAYQLTLWSALWRTAATLVFAGVALTLWVAAILGLILGG